MSTGRFWAKTLAAIVGGLAPALLVGGAVAAFLGGACGPTRPFAPCPPTAAGGMSILVVWCLVAIPGMAQPSFRHVAVLTGAATALGAVLLFVAALG